MFAVLDDYPPPCLLIAREVFCSLKQMQSTFSCWRKVAAKLISRRWYRNIVTVRLPIVLFCVNSKVCRKADFINLLTNVLYVSARMFGTDGRLLRKVEVYGFCMEECCSWHVVRLKKWKRFHLPLLSDFTFHCSNAKVTALRPRAMFSSSCI